MKEKDEGWKEVKKRQKVWMEKEQEEKEDEKVSRRRRKRSRIMRSTS